MMFPFQEKMIPQYYLPALCFRMAVIFDPAFHISLHITTAKTAIVIINKVCIVKYFTNVTSAPMYGVSRSLLQKDDF